MLKFDPREKIVTTNTKGWCVKESILYVDRDDETRKSELEQDGYHQLADKEAIPSDIEALNL